MDISNNVIAPFAKYSTDGNISGIDLNAFVMRFLLFDTYTIETSMFRDISLLVKNFGVNGLIDILNTNHIKIHSSARSVGQINRTDPYRNNKNYPVGPDNELMDYGKFAFSIVDMADRNVYLNRGYKNLKTFATKKEAIDLRRAVKKQLTTPLDFSGPHKYMDWFNESLTSKNDLVKTAVLVSLKEKQAIDTTLDKIILDIKADSQLTYSTESNLVIDYKLDEYAAHQIIESAFLGIASFYQRLSLMEQYNSIGWFSDRDSRILKEDIKLVARELDSSIKESRLTRLLEIKGLPLIASDATINAYKLIHFKDSEECKQFRVWLKDIDNKSDEDVLREVNAFNAAFSNIFTSPNTKIARFLLSTAVGMVDPITGFALGASDAFILDAIIKRNGPISFINNSLPSIFKD